MSKSVEVKVYGQVVDEKEEKKEKEYDDWEIESKIRTLQEAELIKADTKLMAILAPHLEKNIKSLNGLRKLAVKRTAEGR
jgi:F0F1-type ATP synthase beta subunit